MRGPHSLAKRAAPVWKCPTCVQNVRSAFCPDCGERPLLPRDLTLRGLLDQVVQACANIDGPLLRSFRCLLTKPGELTMAYLRGERKPYALPLQLFLVANVIFFAAQSLAGTNIL